MYVKISQLYQIGDGLVDLPEVNVVLVVLSKKPNSMSNDREGRCNKRRLIEDLFHM